MIKTIAKEAGIVILLLIAIVLILGIVFYDYIPKNKTIPIKRQAYEFPEDIKSELKENLDETQNIVKTHYIDETDLNAYESKKDYKKGNPNPFADSSTNSSTEVTNTEVTNNINSISNETNTENKEVYYNKSGKF